MTDIERFFHRLVANLADTDPARLRRPIPLTEIHRSIVPYRTNRRALGLDSSEDYEMLLLRLCAGEENLARAEPEDVRLRFAEEARQTNPDLGILHRYEDVVLMLRSEALRWALGHDPSAAFAPPPPPSREVETTAPPEPVWEDAAAEVGDTHPAASAEPTCLECRGALPTDRRVTFCPHCGRRQIPDTCPGCGAEVEPEWRHCVACGRALGER